MKARNLMEEKKILKKAGLKMAQCQAQSKRNGQGCKRAAAPGRKVCAMHGGKTPRGPASPHWKHGLRSKLPERLKAGFDGSLSNQEQFSLRDQVALVETLQEAAVEGMDDGECGYAWREARDAFREFRVGNQLKDAAMMACGLDRLEGLLERGAAATAAKDEALNLGERKRRLVDTARRADASYSPDVVMGLLELTVGIITRHVNDERAQNQILHEFSRLRPDTARLDAAQEKPPRPH